MPDIINNNGDDCRRRQKQPPTKIPEELIEEAEGADDLGRLRMLVEEHDQALVEDLEQNEETFLHAATESGASLEAVQLIAERLPNDAFERMPRQ